MNVEFFPRAQLVERLKEGWRLIPGHEYSPDEYAVMMQFELNPEPVSEFHAMRAFQRPKVGAVRLCDAEGCTNRHHGRGLCVKHFMAIYRRKPAKNWEWADRKMAGA